MNAEEARKRSLENVEKETKAVEYLIESATNDGTTQLRFETKFSDGTIEWLRKNGYKYEEIRGSVYFVSW
jgi:hypothetical protein